MGMTFPFVPENSRVLLVGLFVSVSSEAFLAFLEKFWFRFQWSGDYASLENTDLCFGRASASTTSKQCISVKGEISSFLPCNIPRTKEDVDMGDFVRRRNDDTLEILPAR